MHASRQSHDQFTGWATHCSRSKNFISAFFCQNLEHTGLSLAVSTVESLIELGPGIKFNFLFMALFREKSNVRHFGVSVGRVRQ